MWNPPVDEQVKSWAPPAEDALDSSSGLVVPDNLRKIAQALYAPARLGRALGVGAETALTQVLPFPKVGNIPEAVQAGKEAFKPGFQPKEGQHIGSLLGEAAGMAPVLAAGAMVPGGLPAEIATGAALSGGVTALQQASEKGRVKITPTLPTSVSDAIPDSVIGNTIFGGALSALPQAVQTFNNAAKNVALKVLPRTFAKTAGIPERATESAIENPSILSSTHKDIQEQAINVMDAVQKAKQKVGDIFGKIVKKYAGLDSPVDQILSQESTPPARSFDEIKNAWRDAKDGSLFNKTDVIGSKTALSNQEKLAVLTNLKREANQYANYFKKSAPNSVAPIDSASSAAAKKIASEIDDIRSSLPNGKKLQVADNAWETINQIYNGLQKDLSDPGKAEDTLFKLYKGDMSAITAGRTAQKFAALRKVESLSGQKVLDSINDAFTEREFNKKVGKGLSHTLLAGGEAGTALTALFTGHPLLAAAAGGAELAGSPKALGLGIRGASKLGGFLKKAAPGARAPLIAALIASQNQ